MTSEIVHGLMSLSVFFFRFISQLISVWETDQGGQEVGPRPTLSNLIISGGIVIAGSAETIPLITNVTTDKVTHNLLEIVLSH